MKKTILSSFLTLAILVTAGCINQQQKSNTTPQNPVQSNTTQSTVVSSATSWSDTMNIEETPTTTQNTTLTTASLRLADIANHKTQSDCRTTINGTVYDVTAYFGQHPGGDKNLFRVCGMDATDIFNRKHGNDTKANNILAGFEIGTLAQ